MAAERGAADAPIPAAVLEQAAEWLLRLHEDPAPPLEHACAQWRAQHPDHARAWQRAQHLQALIAQVPAPWALPVLGRAATPGRRTAVKRLGLWLTLLPAGWVGWQLLATPTPGTSLQTAIGQRRRLTLADGSTLHLDTDTAVRVQFDGHHRQLLLERGQILVETATDAQVPSRPFLVRTAHGRVRALGTRFTVRVDDQRTALALFEGALQIVPDKATPWRLAAGEQAWFDSTGGMATNPLDDSADTWTTGMRVADALPLGTLLADLSRYRRGVIRCDPDIARLPVSGAFPLDDSDRSLAMLEATYPVRVQRSAGGWWVVVEARSR